jgi:hypothetical protein
MPENYVLLERTELNDTATSVTFANIPQTGYTDLKIVCSTRTDYAGFLDLNMFLNGNASSGYSWRRLNGDGGSATSTSSTSAGVIPSATLGTTSTANTFANTEIYIPNYTSTTSKSVSIDAVTENNATTSYQTFTAGLSTLSTAITSVSFGLGAGNFVANSTFSLYGIAALGTTPAIAPKASGGNRIDNDGTYWYHTFTSSGSFVPQTAITADLLVVAGGGGGGDSASGGGGAGGYRLLTSQSLIAQSYTCTVGSGGTGASGTAVTGANGANSVFDTITSTGGGGGGGDAQPAGNGGSGGGGAYNPNSGATPGTASPAGQGNNGGSGNNTASNTDFAGGGGGGAGAVGVNGASGSTGGAGSNSASAWASATNTGVSGFYAGGGGGARGSNLSAASGGSGGGGTGARRSTSGPTAGTVNTGGGGGGGDTFSSRGPAGNGGSGIIIVRYPIA